nr:hypothetical protein [Tanacetum cinerariifolium]
SSSFNSSYSGSSSSSTKTGSGTTGTSSCRFGSTMELEDVIEVEDTVESEDETVPASVYEVGESSTTPFLREDSDGDLCLKKDRMRLSMFRLKMRRVHHLSRKDLLNHASKVYTFDSRCCRRMIKESIDAAIAAERARHVNARDDARGYGPVRGQDVAPVVRNECAKGKKVKFTAATLQGPVLTWWNSKTATIESAKIKGYIRGLSDKIKGEVTSSRPASLNEAVRMAYKLMEQKSQAKDERVLKGKKQK